MKQTKEIRKTRVSVLSSFFDKEPMSIPVEELMSLTQDKKVKEITQSIRRLRTLMDDEKQPATLRMQSKNDAARLKQQLQAFFPAVLLEGGKTRKHIRQFLPLMGFDVDHISEERATELMALLKDCKHVVFAQPSSSQKGVHGVIMTDCADFLNSLWDGKNTHPFDFVWTKMQSFVNNLLNEEVDTQCKNPEHTLALNYDEQTFLNLDVEPLHIDTSDYQAKGKKKSPASKSKKTSAVAVEEPRNVHLDDVLDDILVEVESKGKTFDEGERNAYIYQFAAICNAYGVKIEDVLAYCQQEFAESDFSEQEITTTIRSAYTKEENHGTRKRKRHHGSYEEIMNIINDYGEWRYNELKMMYEVKQTDSKVWRSAGDTDYNDLYLKAKEQNIITTPSEFRTFIGSHQTLHVNPIKDYLDNLPKCTILPDGRCKIDGREETRDYIAEVFAHIHSTTNAETVAYYGKKWVVQMVKTWINSKERNEIVLGLLGPQGKYKTTFFKFLLPPEMREDYFDTKSDPGLFNKDEFIKMCTHLIYLQEEFDAMGKQQLNQFKAVVSQSHINVRPPYFKDPIVAHKSCSFAFTGNEREILNDYTGNRRFVPFYIESIDNPYQYEIDHEAFYSQAYALAQEDSGFISYIESGEQEQLDVHNQAFTLIDDEDELIEKFLGRPANSTAGVWETIGIITNYLQQQAFKPTLSKRKTGAYLRKKKFEHKNSNRGEVFYVIYLTRAEIESRAKMENNESNDAA